MAEHLWILRHGDAEPHGTRVDELRRLTPRGEEQSRAAGRALAALELEFELVATSPRVRALETARLACEALGGEPVVEAAIGGGFDAESALELTRAAGDGKRVLIVGHNPDLDQIVLDVTGARVALKKGAIAGIRLERGGRGSLLTLLRPREIARIGAS